LSFFLLRAFVCLFVCFSFLFAEILSHGIPLVELTVVPGVKS